MRDLGYAGNPNVMVCERGTMFGYSDLIVDPRNIVSMRDCDCPVTVDITHALQQPAGKPLEVRNFIQWDSTCACKSSMKSSISAAADQSRNY